MSIKKKILSLVLSASVLLSFASCAGKPSAAVTVGITQEPTTFDPHTVQAAGDEEIIFNIYEGLFRYDSKGNLNQCLASESDVKESGDDYSFKIREGVKFHNGKDLTVNDVVYSVKRAAGLLEGQDAPLISELSNIKDCSASDGKVNITLKAPDSDFLNLLTFGIVPEGSGDELGKQPVGTGPFSFESYTVGVNVTLKAFADYWQGKAAVDTAVFKIVADMDAGLLELQNGQIDIFPHFTKERADQLSKDQFNILSNGSNMVQIFALNNAKAPLDNPKVREAINLAVDRDTVIKQTMDGAGLPLYGPMSPAMGSYYNKDLDGRYTRDAGKAKALLAEAGLADGFDLEITVPSEYLIHVNTAVELQSELKDAGIRVKIKQVDWSTWLSDTYNGRNFQSTVIALTSEYAPYDVMNRYISDSSGNFINYKNEKVDEIMHNIPGELDKEKRTEMYKEVQKLIADDNASCYLQDPNEIVAVSKKYEGYNVYPMYVQDLYTVKPAG